MSYFHVNDNCNGCLACVQNCPASALNFEDKGEKRKLLHNMARCARCCNCWRVCPQEAIEFEYFMQNEWDEVTTLDMIYCKICGEPLYTSNFSKTLSDKLKNKQEYLCPLHREALTSLGKAQYFPGKNISKEVKK